MPSSISTSCPVCGHLLTATCCEEVELRKASYRDQQCDRETLLRGLGITIVHNPSREIAGEWETVPHMPSLLAFLAELPFPPRPPQSDESTGEDLRGNPLG